MSAVTDTIRQGVINLEQGNLRANVELSQTLQGMRDRLHPGFNLTPVNPTAPGVADDFWMQRVLLTNSIFTSEVVAAAVLNREFRDEVGARAHQILMDHGLVPRPVEDATSPSTSDVDGPTGASGPSGVV